MIGSTKVQRPEDPVAQAAKREKDLRTTVMGLEINVQILTKQTESLQEKVNGLEGLYKTVILMYDSLQKQRISELQVRVNGGPTA